MILAQEQDVQVKDDVPGKMKNLVGSLLLTDKRLYFVEANREEDLNISVGGVAKRSATLRYADVEDLGEVSSNPNNLVIPFGSIVSVSGSEGILHPPELKVRWKDPNSGERHVVFTEELIGGRKKDLKDWARTIKGIKDGSITIQRPSAPAPPADSLEGRILHVLGDMQEKGPFEIEQETESQFNVDLDPDEVESSCEKLVVMGFVDRDPDSSGEVFYRKRSPLGEDDLSS